MHQSERSSRPTLPDPGSVGTNGPSATLLGGPDRGSARGHRRETPSASLDRVHALRASRIPESPCDDGNVVGRPMGPRATGAGPFWRVRVQTAGHALLQRLCPEEPPVPRLDDGLRTGPYNFGFQQHDPGLGGAFLATGVACSSATGTAVHRQQRRGSPGRRPCPADRCASAVHPLGGRDAHATEDPVVDSTFGLDKVPALTLHNNGVATTIPAKPAVPVFSDANNPWSDCDGDACTGAHPGRYQPGAVQRRHPEHGHKVRVKSVSSTGFMQIDINK